MAEIVGTVASVAQLLHLSAALLAGGYGFLSKVSHAPSEIRSLLTETASINSLLGQLETILETEAKPEPNDSLRALERLGVLNECRQILESIQKTLTSCEDIHGKFVRNLVPRLIWPLREKTTKEALQRLHRLRSILANAVEVNSATTLRRIETSQELMKSELTFLVDRSKSQSSSEDNKTVLSWLCPQSNDGHQSSLKQALETKVAGTGTWFTDSDSFKFWNSSKYNTLWITGLPGSGKTILTASVIEHLQVSYQSSEIIVLYFFCDHREQSKQTLKSFLTSIIEQMLDVSSHCLHKAKTLYDKGKIGSNRLPKSIDTLEYLDIVKDFLSAFNEVFVLVDALDEASEGCQIASALIEINKSAVLQGVKTKIFFSSRFDIRIGRYYEGIAHIRIALAENMRQDIDLFIKADLDRRINQRTIKLRDQNLLGTIQNEIRKRAGTLLQARLQIDHLSTAKNDRHIRSIVQSLPNGLGYTWGMLLCSLASRHPTRVEEMKLILQCLVVALSPLSAAQLAEIVAIQPDDQYLDFDAVTTDPYDTLEAVAPLVVLAREETGRVVVKLSHYSLEEYLCSDEIHNGPARGFSVLRKEANAWLASKCLQYLSFPCHDPSVDEVLASWTSEEPIQYAFYSHAALNWFQYMRSVETPAGQTSVYEPYLTRFLDGIEGSPSYHRWHNVFDYRLSVSEETYHSPICFAIGAGLDGLFEHLLPTLPSVDHVFEDGFTCLTVAVLNNRVRIARKLLDLGASVDLPSMNGDRRLTPLHLAAEYTCEEVFDILLEAGADIHARSTSKTTPFYRACRGGNLNIIRKLKELGSDINAKTWDSWTPLHEAVGNEHEEVVDLLLEWGANPQIVSDNDGTPLDLAELELYATSISEKLRAVLNPRSSSDSEVQRVRP